MAIIYKNIRPDGLTAVLNQAGTLVEWASPAAGSLGSYNGKDSFTLTPSVTVTNGFGATVFSVLSGTLPAGTSLNTSTGVVSGTLNNATGSYTFTIRATNNSVDADREFSTTVTQIASVDWVSPAAGSLGSFNGGESFVFSPSVTVTLGSGSTVYSLQSGTLPLGTTLNTSTGAITGILDAAPYDDVAETYSFTIRATNNGIHADRAFTTSVSEVTLVSWNSPAAGALGASAGGSSFSFTANTTVLDPVGATTYSVATGTLPAGTSLNSATGIISGTLTNAASSFSFTIRVTNNGVSSDRAFTGTVTATTVVSWVSPAAGALGAFDGGASFSLTSNTSVINAVGSTVYSVSSGTLPAGTTLNTSTGVVSGTLTNTGSSFSFTIRATNNSVTSDRAFTGSVTAITVVAWNSPPAGALGVSTGNSSFSFTPSITVTNAVGSTVYSVSSGALPTGTSLNSSTGAITGALTNADSNYAFTIRATNNSVASDRAFTGSVAAVVVTWVSPTAGAQGESAGGSSYTFTSNVSVTNGIGDVGSFAFNGSSKLSVPGLITGNFSMEAWVYPTSGGSSAIFSDGAYNSGSSLMVFLNSGGIYVNSGAAAGNIVNGAGSVPLNTWSHIVWERSGATNTIYVNGSSVTSFSYNSNVFGASGFAIGSTTASQYGFTGNMTNIRLVTSTVYNGNFTTPTSPPTAIYGTALLLKATTSGALLTDSSGLSTSVTNSGTTWSASSPFTAVVFSVLSGSVPAGTTLDATTGIISGTLTNTPSSYSFTIRATASSVTADRAFTGTVTGTTVVTWNSPTAGALGASAGGSSYSFSANTSVVNGVGSTVYSVSSGALPAGTSLDSATGIISGTLTNAAASYSFTIRATNNSVYSERSYTGSVTLTTTYAVSPSVSSVDEGNAVIFTVTTVGVSDGTTLYWTNNGTTSAADFSDSANSGSFTITSNSGTFTRTLSADVTTEGSETIIAQVRTVSTSGTVVATANTVTVNDTSLAPAFTYAISPSVTSVDEGNSVTYTVTTTGVANATTLYYTNNGTTSAADFSESGAIVLNGSNQYLSIASPATSLIQWYTGSYTLEYWIKPSAFSQGANSQSTVIGNMLWNSTATYWSFGPVTGGTVKLYYWNGSINALSTSTTIPTNTWTHLALVNNAGTVTIYINGVNSASAAIAGSPLSDSPTNLVIGSTNSTFFNGSISNLRITNRALYTANFTPSTGTLMPVANTSLLLRASTSATLVTDSSTNNYTVTNNGTATFNANGPFGDGASVVINNNTGSFTRTLSTDLSTEGSETIIMNLRTVSNAGTVVATANTVTVNDTSTQPVTTYAISPSVSSVNEGNTVAYTVTTAGLGVTDGTSLYWTNNGTTSASDFTEGGSIKFVSGQTVTVPDNAAFSFGTGDFTVEAWVYINSGQTGVYCIFNVGGAGVGSYGLYWVASSQKFQTGRYGDAAGAGTTTNTYAVGQWYHVANVRSGGTSKLYINGVADTGSTYAMGSVTASTSVSLASSFGGAATNSGYTSNLRVVKGSAVYSANFTPSTTPLTAVTNTVLLLNNKSSTTALTDSSTNAFTLTNSSTTFDNTNPFAGGSISFSTPLSNYLQVTTDAMAGDFTVEAWVNLTTLASIQVIIGNYPGWEIWVSTSGTLAYYEAGYKIQTALAITANTWNHIALVRQGSTTKMYINGVADVNTYAVAATLASQSSYIGRDSGVNGGLTGKIANLRIVNGTAVYTANFTPPTAQLTAVANTALLLNAASSTTMSTDSSTNNKSVTVTGTPTWSPISPVTSSLTNGSFKVYSNSATITRTLLNDLTTEGSESIILNVRTTSTSGTVVATANTVTVNDTSKLVTASYLVVAGGGGGAVNSSNGGGAGGLLSGTSSLTTGAVYSVVVGAGGLGAVSPTGASAASGSSGANSSIVGTSVSLTAIGGGFGAIYNGTGGSGGSGGGGATAGTGTAGQGNNGGTGSATLGNPAGGGGAGAAGGNFSGGTFPTTGTSGAGGAGLASDIITTTQATTYSIGQVSGGQVWFAGGGGGCGDSRGTNGGAGGLGGGGAGSKVANANGGSGLPASGGGGGGASYYSTPQGNGGNGGKGVVIISVPTASYSGTTTGSPTVVTNGSNTAIIFTSNGTYTA